MADPPQSVLSTIVENTLQEGYGLRIMRQVWHYGMLCDIRHVAAVTAAL